MSLLEDIRISPYVLEFVKQSKKFSDLKLEETAHSGIWIQNIREPCFAKLKEEMRNVVSFSYLLEEYDLLCEDEKKEIISQLEKKFRVKCSPYQVPLVGDIPVVFPVNPLISISCVENSDPENIPLDSLITVDSQPPQTTSDYKTIEISKIENYTILEKDTWNLPMNHHLFLLVPDIDKKKKTTYSWNLLFEKCLKLVSKNGRLPHTIGISISTKISDHLEEFCQKISTAVKDLPQNSPNPSYVLLFVPTYEMMREVVNILKNSSAVKPDLRFSPEPKESYFGAKKDECTVDVIKGLINDQKVDAVVASTDMSLNLNLGGVASALSKQAGPELQRECYRKFPNGLPFPEIAVSNGYHLQCQYVFFGALPHHNGQPNVCTFVENCLQKATDNGLSSIAFPALGTGLLNYEPADVAAQMASAIATFKAKTPKSSLKTIRIVIYSDTIKGMNHFFDLKKQFAKDKDSMRAVSKRKPESPLHNEQKQVQSCNYKQLQWIPFVNYSTKRETLEHVMKEFVKYALEPSLPATPDYFSQNEQEPSEGFGAAEMASQYIG